MGQEVAVAIVRTLLASALVPASLGAQAPATSAQERLGQTHFITSCEPAVEKRFDRAIAVLHSFWYSEAIKEFNRVVEADPGCAMAYWGIAMSNWGFRRQLPALRAGRAAVERAQAAHARTPREKDYIAAVARLYDDFERVNPPVRINAYVQAMEQLTKAYPADREAVIFYALGILDTVVPTDKTFAARLKAGAILEKEFKTQPDHPGIAHYIIHAYDVPPLADRALAAAYRYAKIAPAAPHALHMPSHTFTRLGYWEESIDSNVQSAAAAEKEGASGTGERLHALDYAAYGYLQTAQDRAALKIVRQIPSLAASGPTPEYGSANAFAVAAIPARYVLERHAWTEAANLQVHATGTPSADALTHFARALGLARTRKPAGAQREIERLTELRDKLTQSNDRYWAGQVEIQRVTAAAWTAWAAGQRDEALRLLRTAADLEDATEKAGTTPGPLMPARELLGDMLLELNQPAKALSEYEATLKREPNRFWSVYGVARAAQLAGDSAKASRTYSQLVKICRRADQPGRSELAQARKAAAGVPDRR